MADRHTDPPDAGAQEAAKLSAHAGIAVIMDYGIRESFSNAGPPLQYHIYLPLVMRNP